MSQIFLIKPSILPDFSSELWGPDRKHYSRRWKSLWDFADKLMNHVPRCVHRKQKPGIILFLLQPDRKLILKFLWSLFGFELTERRRGQGQDGIFVFSLLFICCRRASRRKSSGEAEGNRNVCLKHRKVFLLQLSARKENCSFQEVCHLTLILSGVRQVSRSVGLNMWCDDLKRFVPAGQNLDVDPVWTSEDTRYRGPDAAASPHLLPPVWEVEVSGVR